MRPSLKFDPYVSSADETAVKDDEGRVIPIENNDKLDEVIPNQKEVNAEDLHTKTEK